MVARGITKVYWRETLCSDTLELEIRLVVRTARNSEARVELASGTKNLTPDFFFSLHHQIQSLTPRGSTTQLVQPGGGRWIISNPIPLYRFEQRVRFFREKKTIPLSNFVVAGQLESSTRKRPRHWRIPADRSSSSYSTSGSADAMAGHDFQCLVL